MVRINEIEPRDATRKRQRKLDAAYEANPDFYGQNINIIASFNDWLPW